MRLTNEYTSDLADQEVVQGRPEQERSLGLCARRRPDQHKTCPARNAPPAQAASEPRHHAQRQKHGSSDRHEVLRERQSPVRETGQDAAERPSARRLALAPARRLEVAPPRVGCCWW